MPQKKRKKILGPFATIFEVLDSYFGSQTYPSERQLTDSQILELREQVLEFYRVYDLVPRREFETRLYLGGFLSSPPLTIESAPVISSSLLCADSLVVFDPLHYWFCEEQYKRPRLPSAPPGWRDLQTRIPNLALTRNYLSFALRCLKSIRPLVDAGVVLLIPAEQITAQQHETISEFANGISDRLNPLPTFSETFGPDEITVDDNQKGLFVFAGGDREKQINKYLVKGVEHFARDIVLANATDALYCAPFKWEQHLGQSALDGFFDSAFQAKAVEAIRNLRLPILSELSPDVLVKIHKDSGYTEFRSGLTEALRNVQAEIGTANFADQVAQIERDILVPKIEKIYQEINSENFQKFTKARQEGVFAFGQTFIVSFATGSNIETSLARGAVGGAVFFLRRLLTRASRSRDSRIWTQLIPENPMLPMYGSPLTLSRREEPRWEIDEQPSMRLKVSAGIFKKFPISS